MLSDKYAAFPVIGSYVLIRQSAKLGEVRSQLSISNFRVKIVAAVVRRAESTLNGLISL